MRGVPPACSTDDLDKLRASQEDKHRLVTVTVTGCAYSCCGKGWQRRDGYEQAYTGYIDNLQEPEGRRGRDVHALQRRDRHALVRDRVSLLRAG
jgi:hypothetical protein